MIYLMGFRLKDEISNADKQSFPLSINALKNFKEFRFKKPVTFFIGENGCGKSTIVESIADYLGIPADGGTKDFQFYFKENDKNELRTDDGDNDVQFAHHDRSELSKYLVFAKGATKFKNAFFFRAESFYNLAQTNLVRRYSTSLLQESHGESFIDFLENTFDENSLYILDEPEAALSPRNQMKVLRLIDRLSKRGTQFIISTHSPILLSYRDGDIYSLDNGFENIEFEKSNIYILYKRFINDYEKFQEMILDD